MNLRPGKIAFFPQTPLLFGNPKIGGECSLSYPALPGAEAEVTEIAALLHGSAIVGKYATKDTLLALLERSDFIYLATHGFADADDPLNGYVLTSSSGGDSCDFWTAAEIQKCKMKEDIVVLSACQTGLGKAHKAGIIGLARAFIIGGAWTSVMSLWSVDDEATKKLMVLFVEKLKQENDYFPASHLRQAALEFKKTDTDPLHWSAFMTMGFSYPPGTVRKLMIRE
jgi:CHAT domain-containing protein